LKLISHKVPRHSISKLFSNPLTAPRTSDECESFGQPPVAIRGSRNPCSDFYHEFLGPTRCLRQMCTGILHLMHRAASEQRGNTLNGLRTLPESQGQNLALTVLYVPRLLDSSGVRPAIQTLSSEHSLQTPYAQNPNIRYNERRRCSRDIYSRKLLKRTTACISHVTARALSNPKLTSPCIEGVRARER